MRRAAPPRLRRWKSTSVASGSSDPGWTPPPKVDVAVPPNHRIDYNFNVGWKFLRRDGINRVFVRSIAKAGAIKVTARRAGLASDSVTVTSVAVEVTKGLTTRMPPVF